MTVANKPKRLEVCTSLLARNKQEPLLYRIVTCDEKWVPYDNRKRSAQWLSKAQPAGRHPKPHLHTKKIKNETHKLASIAQKFNEPQSSIELVAEEQNGTLQYLDVKCFNRNNVIERKYSQNEKKRLMPASISVLITRRVHLETWP